MGSSNCYLTWLTCFASPGVQRFKLTWLPALISVSVRQKSWCLILLCFVIRHSCTHTEKISEQAFYNTLIAHICDITETSLFTSRIKNKLAQANIQKVLLHTACCMCTYNVVHAWCLPGFHLCHGKQKVQGGRHWDVLAYRYICRSVGTHPSSNPHC